MKTSGLDIIVLLKLLFVQERWNYADVADSLGISPSQVHSSVKRLIEARLLDPESKKPFPHAVNEYLIHGVKYAFPSKRGYLVQGIPTSYAAPPLAKRLSIQNDLIPVWAEKEGKAKGYSLEPIHKHAPQAARKDRQLYEMLALVDVFRDGKAREKKIAEEELKKRLYRNAIAHV